MKYHCWVSDVVGSLGAPFSLSLSLAIFSFLVSLNTERWAHFQGYYQTNFCQRKPLLEEKSWGLDDHSTPWALFPMGNTPPVWSVRLRRGSNGEFQSTQLRLDCFCGFLDTARLTRVQHSVSWGSQVDGEFLGVWPLDPSC